MKLKLSTKIGRIELSAKIKLLSHEFASNYLNCKSSEVGDVCQNFYDKLDTLLKIKWN
jgi:hypothetical protein